MGQRSLLNPLLQPIAIRNDQIAQCETAITVKQHDYSWLGRDFTIKNSKGSVLFTVTGKRFSNSARREFKDATGLPLFELRRRYLSKRCAWFLELPGGGGERILSVRHIWAMTRAKFDAVIKTNDKDVTLEVRGKDPEHIITHVHVDGRRIVNVRRKVDRKEMRGLGNTWGHRPEWHVEVAEGLDLALAAVLVVVIADLYPEQPIVIG